MISTSASSAFRSSFETLVASLSGLSAGHCNVTRVAIQLLIVCLFSCCGCGSATSLEELANRGWLAYLSKDQEKLTGAMTAADKLDKRSGEARFLRGLTLVRGGQPELALVALREATRSENLQKRVRIAAAQAYFDLWQFSAVTEVLEQALRIDGDDIEAHRILAGLYYDIGANPRAIHHLEAVARLDPRDPRPHRLIGLMRKDFQDYPAAVSAYRESLERGPADSLAAEIRLELAQSLSEQRNYAAALEALGETTCTPEVLAVRIRCFRILGQMSELKRAVSQALAIKDPPLALQIELGDYFASVDDLDNSIDCYQKAVALDPVDFVPRYKLSTVYSRAGRLEEAKQELDASLAKRQLFDRLHALQNQAMQNPNDADLRFQIGQAALALERQDLARAWFSAALGLDPGHAAAREAMRQK